MADAAIENIVATNLKAWIIAGNTTLFNRSNVLIVPVFTQPPMGTTDLLCQIRPELYIYGQAGWAYMQRINVDIALFKRAAVDIKREWEGIITALNESLLLLRMRVNNYNGGSGTGAGTTLPMAIHFYDSNQTMSPRLMEDKKGEIVKDALWTSFRVWGLTGSNVSEFKSPST